MLPAQYPECMDDSPLFDSRQRKRPRLRLESWDASVEQPSPEVCSIPNLGSVPQLVNGSFVPNDARLGYSLRVAIVLIIAIFVVILFAVALVFLFVLFLVWKHVCAACRSQNNFNRVLGIEQTIRPLR